MGENKFTINLDNKPYLSHMKNTDVKAFKDIVGTFVGVMEIAAQKKWHDLPKAIHSSLSFQDLVAGVLNAVMTTAEIEPNAYATLEADLHPLALLSDQRKNLLSDEPDSYDWRSHFALDTDNVSKETIEEIIRKVLYLVRWIDIETVSKALIANQFPIMDSKDIQKLPFQPALQYQKEHLGDLHIGKFFHEVGAFNCGEIDKDDHICPACNYGELTEIKKIKVCHRCNGGYKIKEELEF